MATKFEKPLEASQVTPVADMPPLEVVTEGIPAQEHIEAPPTAQPEAAPVAPERTAAHARMGSGRCDRVPPRGRGHLRVHAVLADKHC